MNRPSACTYLKVYTYMIITTCTVMVFNRYFTSKMMVFNRYYASKW